MTTTLVFLSQYDGNLTVWHTPSLLLGRHMIQVSSFRSVQLGKREKEFSSYLVFCQQKSLFWRNIPSTLWWTMVNAHPHFKIAHQITRVFTDLRVQPLSTSRVETIDW